VYRKKRKRASIRNDNDGAVGETFDKGREKDPAARYDVADARRNALGEIIGALA